MEHEVLPAKCAQVMPGVHASPSCQGFSGQDKHGLVKVKIRTIAEASRHHPAL